MLFVYLFRHLKWNSEGEGRSRRRHVPPRRASRALRQLPRFEALEDRTVPSTLTVTSAVDDGSAGTLRAVLAAAHDGDTVQFAEQIKGRTIILAMGALAINQSLDIEGPGAAKLTINGNAAGRIFAISGATVTISGLTLADGLASDGAGILNAGNLTLVNDVLSGNVAQGVAGDGLFGDSGGRGGGVENQAGATLNVSSSIFTGNQALGAPGGGNAFGGGIYNEAGTVIIDQSTFTGNQAIAGNGGSIGAPATLPGIRATLLGVGAGGGIWNDGGSVDVTDSLLNGNLDQGGSNSRVTSFTPTFVLAGTAIGGAIGSGAFFTTVTPNVAISGSTLRGNQSQGGTHVAGTLFFGDTGSGLGGGIAAIAGDVSVSDSTISGNLAETGASLTVAGGGIYDELDLGFAFLARPRPPSPSLNIAGSTIKGNVALGNTPSATSFGGGVDTNAVNVLVSNSTVIGNEAIGAIGGGFFLGFIPLGGGQGEGGGIASLGGFLTIRDSTINDNLAQAGAGGAHRRERRRRL